MTRKSSPAKKRYRGVNGWLRFLMAAGIIVALFVLGQVFKVRREAKNREAVAKIQYENLLRALELYDSLGANRLRDVAQQVHPEKNINVGRIFPALKEHLDCPADSGGRK